MAERIQNPPTAWGKYVKSVLDAHKTWTGGQRYRTQVPPGTVGSWLTGTPPGPEGVIKFARGFGEDVREALRIAGHNPDEILSESGVAGGGGGSEADDRVASLRRMQERMRAVEAEFGDSVPLQRATGDAPLTEEQLDALEAGYRLLLEERRQHRENPDPSE